MKLLVTGATGYIGERFVRLARERGDEVVAATRKPMSGTAWVRYDLSDQGRLAWPEGIEAIVHLAAATGTGGTDEAREVAAAHRLLDAARERGARFLFVSSQTARADAPTAYGRAKWRIEQDVLEAGGTVVRPGQVYGGPERALFGVLVGLARRLPALPAFMPPPRVQPVHVDDLAAALHACVHQAAWGGRTLCVAQDEPVTFTEFLRAIADHRLRTRRRFVPVPSVIVRLGAAMSGESSALARLLSLFELQPMTTQRDLADLGVALRPLGDGMSRSGRARSELVRESRSLLEYVLKEPPAEALVRRQVRCVEALRNGRAMGSELTGWRLALADFRGNASGAELRWRLDAAAAIAEASPQGRRRFASSGGRIHALRMLVGATATEAAMRLARLIAR